MTNENTKLAEGLRAHKKMLCRATQALHSSLSVLGDGSGHYCYPPSAEDLAVAVACVLVHVRVAAGKRTVINHDPLVIQEAQRVFGKTLRELLPQVWPEPGPTTASEARTLYERLRFEEEDANHQDSDYGQTEDWTSSD